MMGINDIEGLVRGSGNEAGGSYNPDKHVFHSEPEDIDMVSCAICGHSFAKDDCVKNEENYWLCETCSK